MTLCVNPGVDRGARAAKIQDMTAPMDLEGKLLIAMPGMPDPRFRHAVVFLCSHSETAALGLVVNKPATGLEFSMVLKDMGLRDTPPERDIRVHLGGPVESSRGFVLHSPDYGTDDGTIRVGDYGMTGSADILDRIASGAGPSRAILALGYAGWGPGQLDAEIGDNGWLLADSDPEILFGAENDGKWHAALALIGIDPRHLSGAAGHA